MDEGDKRFRAYQWRRIREVSQEVANLGGIVQNAMDIKDEQLDTWSKQVDVAQDKLEEIRQDILMMYYEGKDGEE